MVNWQTVLDINFSELPNQSFATDTTYTVGGYTWTKINSTNDNSTAQIVNGTGLQFTPKTGCDWYASRTAPSLLIPVSTLISNFDFSTPWRIWVYGSYASQGTNDALVSGIEAGAYTNNWGNYYGNTSGVNDYTVATVFNAGQGGFVQSASTNTSNVGLQVMPLGVQGQQQISLTGTYSSGWPSINSLVPTCTQLITSVNSQSITASTYNFFFGARKASSNAFVATFIRIRIDTPL